MKKLILLLLIILAVPACNTTGNAINIQKETISEPLVYFCPRDGCEDIWIDYVNRANISIHCALYDLDLKNLSKAFSEKSKEVDVKLVIDKDNINEVIGGKNIVYDNDNQLMHNKFCIFDNKIVTTGSFNPTYNDAYKNNNNIIIIESKNLAMNYELEFNELWNYNFGKGHKTIDPILYFNNKKYENYFCPEDDCQKQVIDALNRAEESIYFMTFSFTDSYISKVLIAKKKQGLDVKGIGESKRFSMQFEQYNFLNENGVETKNDKNQYTLHHKVFIIDNQTVILGSYNPTKAATEKNDENMLIVHDRDIANRFLEEFSLLFD
jgi:phosphatidylserine/phosphatidylglycerophosphate/cardiolipin synthase-like enzyme